MVRSCKLTPEIQKRISDNIALGLTYSLAASSAGITYKTFNIWLNKGKTEKSGKYYQFYKYIIKCNADGALKLLERLNEAAKVEIVKFACLYWRDVSLTSLVGG